MYKEVYTEQYGHFKYPVGPRFFQIKQWIIERFADQENAIVIELQAEPWLAGTTTDAPIGEQLDAMDEKQLRSNVEFARQGGFQEIYLWGVEWWYWMKTTGERPEVWDEARKLFEESRKSQKEN
jgi:hypothetical protein